MKDKPPAKPSPAELATIQAARDKRAEEWAAIRMRVLGPSTATFAQETALAGNPNTTSTPPQAAP